MSRGRKASKKLKSGSKQPRGSLLHRVEGLDTLSGEFKTCMYGRNFVRLLVVDVVARTVTSRYDSNTCYM